MPSVEPEREKREVPAHHLELVVRELPQTSPPERRQLSLRTRDPGKLVEELPETRAPQYEDTETDREL